MTGAELPDMEMTYAVKIKIARFTEPRRVIYVIDSLT